MKPYYSFLILLFTLATLKAAESNTVVLNEVGVKNLRIETQLVEESEFEESIFALGRIEIYPGQRAAISSRVAGRALEVFVKNDHSVSKGDVTLTVETRQPGNPPPTIKITAPISGLVSSTQIVPGEPVEPDRVLAEIVDLSKVFAVASVPEHLAGKLKPGLKARITVPAVPGKEFAADLEYLGALADSESGTVKAAFHVENPDLLLRPGMRAEFSIVVEKSDSVVTIPRTALQGDVPNRFVYVKDFDLPNAFVKTPVVVGRINDRNAEILSGLFPADEIVTQGAYSLAFAGGGSISLKAALDAAHGHEHAEDGSELTEAKKAQTGTQGPDQGVSTGKNSPFWKIVSGVLFLLLLVVSFVKRGGSHAE